MLLPRLIPLALGLYGGLERKGLPTPILMPIGPDYEKLFYAGRLNPSLPEHKKLIDGYLAMYSVHAPEKAEKLKNDYYPKVKEVEVKEEKEVKKPRKIKILPTE